MRYLLTIPMFILFSVIHSTAQENIQQETKQHRTLDAQILYTSGLGQPQANFAMKEFPHSIFGAQLKGSLTIEQEVSFTFSLGVLHNVNTYDRFIGWCAIGDPISSTNPLNPWYDFSPVRDQFLAFPALIGINFSVFTFLSVGLEVGANLGIYTETMRFYYFHSNNNPQITLDENGEYTQDRSITRLLSPEFLLAPNIQFRFPLFDNLYCIGGIRYFTLQHRLNAGIGVGIEF